MIKRSKRKSNFTIINNDIFADNFLSLEGRGLLTYLLSKPDNWIININAVAKSTQGTAQKRGINKIYDLLKELIDKGFIVRKKLSTGGVDYTVYDEPVNQNSEQEKPKQEKPKQEKPKQGFGETYKELKGNKNCKRKKERNINNPEPPQGGNVMVDDVLKSTPKNQSKNKETSSDKFEPLKSLLSLSVDETIAKDWLEVRKSKRSKLTQTSLNGLVNESTKAGISVNDAVRICAERSWITFRANWSWKTEGGRLASNISSSFEEYTSPEWEKIS